MPTNGLGHTKPIPFETDLLGLHSDNASRYPALIESAADETDLGRYDILFACPSGHLRLDAEGALDGNTAQGRSGFLSSFDAWWEELKQPVETQRGSPFSGGWFMLLGYELANEIEPRLALDYDRRQPVAVALRIPLAVVRDRTTRTAWIVAEPGHERDLEQVAADIAALAPAPDARPLPLVEHLQEDDPDLFLRAVELAQKHIEAGDIYQANLSRRWTGDLCPDVTPADIYRRLRRANPAPFAGIATLPGISVISSSPERLLRSDGHHVETRPIAGTRPRESGRGDTSRIQELLDHPKERAEHIMLIDLERNDLGRVCKPGSVTVDEFMAIETYTHVHHIVSNVRGELRDDVTPGTMIRSVFPGGSITGCPKVRCMEIIDALENAPRGVYTGAMGYINRDGSADLNILIRTIAVMGQSVSVAAGSGIVAESDPQLELAETRAKARGLLLALTDRDPH